MLAPLRCALRDEPVPTMARGKHPCMSALTEGAWAAARLNRWQPQGDRASECNSDGEATTAHDMECGTRPAAMWFLVVRKGYTNKANWWKSLKRLLDTEPLEDFPSSLLPGVESLPTQVATGDGFYRWAAITFEWAKVCNNEYEVVLSRRSFTRTSSPSPTSRSPVEPSTCSSTSRVRRRQALILLLSNECHRLTPGPTDHALFDNEELDNHQEESTTSNQGLTLPQPTRRGHPASAGPEGRNPSPARSRGPTRAEANREQGMVRDDANNARKAAQLERANTECAHASHRRLRHLSSPRASGSSTSSTTRPRRR